MTGNTIFFAAMWVVIGVCAIRIIGAFRENHRWRTKGRKP